MDLDSRRLGKVLFRSIRVTRARRELSRISASRGTGGPGLIFRARSRKYNDWGKKGPGEGPCSSQRIADKPTRRDARQTEERGERRRLAENAACARLYQFFDRLLIPLKRSPLPPPPTLPLYMHELANFFGGSTPFVLVKRIAVYTRGFMRVFRRFHVKLPSRQDGTME